MSWELRLGQYPHYTFPSKGMSRQLTVQLISCYFLKREHNLVRDGSITGRYLRALYDVRALNMLGTSLGAHGNIQCIQLLLYVLRKYLYHLHSSLIETHIYGSFLLQQHFCYVNCLQHLGSLTYTLPEKKCNFSKTCISFGEECSISAGIQQ